MTDNIRYAAEILNISREYENFRLNNVSMKIKEGRVMGLIGENGAVKTTLIKSILSIIKYKGEIRIFGQKMNDKVKDSINAVLEDVFLSEMLSAKELDVFFKGIYSKWDSDYYFNLLERLKVDKSKIYRNLSKGTKTKLKIASALASKPDFLILDEPTSGLDPVLRDEILSILMDFMENENHTVLISSHITSDLEKIADEITFIKEGEIIFSEDKYDLCEKYGILKCSEEDLEKVDSSFIKAIIKGKYSVEALVENKDELKLKYPELIIDRISIDDIMLFYSKGQITE